MRVNPSFHGAHGRFLRPKVRVGVAGNPLVVAVDVRYPATVREHGAAHVRDNGVVAFQPGLAPLVCFPREVLR